MTPDSSRHFAPIVGASLLIVLAIVFWPVVETVLQLVAVGGIVLGGGVALVVGIVYAFSGGGYVERM